MDTTFAKYWKRNLCLGASRAWEWMGVVGKIMDILIAVGAGVLLGQQNILLFGMITMLVALALYGLCSLIFAVFIVPYQESKKQEDEHKEETEKLQKQTRNLKDKYEKAPVANPLIISAFNDEANQRVGIRLDNTSKTRRVSNIKIRLIGLDYESWGDGKTYPQIGTFSEDNRLFKEGNGFDDGVSISPLGHAFIYIAKNVDSELVLLLEKPEANKNLFREIIEEDRYIELIRKVHPSYLGWKQYLSIFIIEVSVMGDIDGKPTTENSFRDYLYFSHLLSDDNKSGLYRSSTRIMIGLENMYRKGLAFKYESKESENEEKDNPS